MKKLLTLTQIVQLESGIRMKIWPFFLHKKVRTCPLACLNFFISKKRPSFHSRFTLPTELFGLVCLVAGLALFAFAQEKGSYKIGGKMVEKGLYAAFDTSMGKIVCKLFEKETPVTVSNFVALAEGTKEWVDPKTGKKVKNRFYDGLVFHRVIPNFMIQGGCPLGTGTGGPGYQFEDEIVPSLKFDKPYLLAMANAGPGTNGSQFFITHIPTPWLNGRHTIFGEVIEGKDVVVAIGNVPKGSGDRPTTPVVIKKITIDKVK